MTTNEFYEATKGQPLNCKAGSLTLEQAVCMFDAVTAVRICCTHIFHGLDAPHFLAKIEKLPSGKSSIAACRSMLKDWNKWTHQNGPTLYSVQQFLFSQSR